MRSMDCHTLKQTEGKGWEEPDFSVERCASFEVKKIIYSNFGCIFTTDCTDYTDFSSQGATMAGCRTIRMAGAAEAQKSV